MRKTKMHCRFCKIMAVILISFGVAACGGGGSNSGGGNDESGALNISGNWTGSGGSSVYSSQGDIQMTANQNGANVNGTISITNLSLGAAEFICGGTTWDFSGSIRGNNFTFDRVTPAGKTEFRATVTNNQINGTYRTVSGPCSGDGGTFALTRQ